MESRQYKFYKTTMKKHLTQFNSLKIVKSIKFILAFKLSLLLIGFSIYSCKKVVTQPNIIDSSHLTEFSTALSKNIPEIESTVNEYKANESSREKSLDNDYEEKKMKEALIPLIEDSKDLINQFGLTDNEIQEIFVEGNSENTIVLALLLFETHKNNDVKTEISSISVFSSPIYAQTVVGSCVLEAFGIRELAKAAYGQLSKAAMIKLATKVASKYLGPIGVGLAVAEFSYCMYKNY